MTCEAYLGWLGETRHGEWVDGEVIVFLPTTILHADLRGFLYALQALLSLFARRLGLGRVCVEQVEKKLPGVPASRRPDVLFVGQAHPDRLTPLRLVGPADLVVEIVSADSVTRDRVDKFREYEAAGVPGYWILDVRSGGGPSNFYRIGPTGTSESIPPDREGRDHSTALPGCWLRPDWLRQDPLPDPVDRLPEIAPSILSARGHGPGSHDPS